MVDDVVVFLFLLTSVFDVFANSIVFWYSEEEKFLHPDQYYSVTAAWYVVTWPAVDARARGKYLHSSAWPHSDWRWCSFWPAVRPIVFTFANSRLFHSTGEVFKNPFGYLQFLIPFDLPSIHSVHFWPHERSYSFLITSYRPVMHSFGIWRPALPPRAVVHSDRRCIRRYRVIYNYILEAGRRSTDYKYVFILFVRKTDLSYSTRLGDIDDRSDVPVDRPAFRWGGGGVMSLGKGIRHSFRRTRRIRPVRLRPMTLNWSLFNILPDRYHSLSENSATFVAGRHFDSVGTVTNCWPLPWPFYDDISDDCYSISIRILLFFIRRIHSWSVVDGGLRRLPFLPFDIRAGGAYIPLLVSPDCSTLTRDRLPFPCR